MKGNGWKAWWKREWSTWARAVLLACLPMIACLVYCASRGQGIAQVYLPCSERNDELIYYKQVEAILGYGYPRGYFGFNESHALKLSFASWSPVLLLPWVLWGLLFGWNLLSPVLCNLFLLTAAMLLFGLLARPSWRQTGILAFLFFLFQPFSWYMLCGMPEIGCISLLLVFYGAAMAMLRRERAWLLALMFLLAGLLTLMRPYLLLFLFLPGCLWLRREQAQGKRAGEGSGTPGRGERGSGRLPGGKWRAVLGTGAVFAAVLGAYAWINHYLAAEYLEPLYYMDWLMAFFQRGLWGGLQNLFQSLRDALGEFWVYMRRGAVGDLAAGSIFCCYIAVLLLLLFQTLRDSMALGRRRKRGEDAGGLSGQLLLEGHLAFAFLGMLWAQLLMYNYLDGCKHLLTFLAVAVPVIARMRTAYLKKAILTGAVFAWFFFYQGHSFEAYQPDFREEAVADEVGRWQEVLGKELALTGDGGPNYDNTVIWVLTDDLPTGIAYTGWQYLYALPPGFGISCCTSDYMEERFQELRSRYICVVPGGPVEESCIRAGYGKLIGNEHAALYRRD